MNKRGQAILYYMFMQADSEITEHEKKIYNTICAELELDEGDIAKVVEKLQDCKEEQLGCLGYVKKEIHLFLIHHEVNLHKIYRYIFCFYSLHTPTDSIPTNSYHYKSNYDCCCSYR